MVQQETQEQQEQVSPFEEVKRMNHTMAINILIQAAAAAQNAGALSVRDSVMVAGAAEFLTQPTEAKKD